MRFLLLFLAISSINPVFLLTDKETIYTAAVVEYNYSPQEKTEDIADDYIKYINTSKEQAADLDLIIFPESTLNTLSDSTPVPEPLGEIICTSNDTKYREYLKKFSCAAIRHHLTVVINIKEKIKCNKGSKNCPDSEVIYYNTDVVFNELGQVSGRYRKWNLFGEQFISVPNKPELVTIVTKNNVKFGIFTCFDILFGKPALDLTRNLGIKNIIFPSAWFSELPYLTALQVQQMWAHENNVNLLAAGSNYPSTGSGGSGIYCGEKGPLAHTIVPSPGGTKVLIEKIPRLELNMNPYLNFEPLQEDIDKLAKEMDDFYLIADSSIPDSTSVVLDTEKNQISQIVCNGDSPRICCRFNITISIESTMNAPQKHVYTYHLMAFNGVRSFSGVRNASIESCGLVACLNDSILSCGKRFSNYSDVAWPINFEKIVVVANYTADTNRIQFPNSLLASLRPVSPDYTEWRKEVTSDVVTRTHILTVSQNKLLTFGILGRDFNRDEPVQKSKSRLFFLNTILFSIILLLIIGRHFN